MERYRSILKVGATGLLAQRQRRGLRIDCREELGRVQERGEAKYARAGELEAIISCVCELRGDWETPLRLCDTIS